MKIKYKIISSIAVLLLVMLVFPLLVINFAEARDALGWVIILFLGVNPITSIILGILAGTDIRKLWWIPLVVAIAFPLLYWLVLKTVILELFVYSGMYLVVGIIVMFITKLIKKNVKK